MICHSGAAREYGSNLARPVDFVLGSWQINGIYTARTGAPYTVTQPGDFPNVGDGSARPDLVGDPTNVVDKSIDNWFNTDAFRLADRFRWGTAGRNI